MDESKLTNLDEHAVKLKIIARVWYAVIILAVVVIAETVLNAI